MIKRYLTFLCLKIISMIHSKHINLESTHYFCLNDLIILQQLLKRVNVNTRMPSIMKLYDSNYVKTIEYNYDWSIQL